MKRAFLMSCVLVLAACGGVGSPDDVLGGGDEEGAGEGPSSNSYWSVDGRRYNRKSSQQDAPASIDPFTFAYSQGQCDDVPIANYRSCSAIGFQADQNAEPGELEVAFTPFNPGKGRVIVDVTFASGPNGTDDYYHLYRATSGRVRMSIDDEGNYHFEIIGSLEMKNVPTGRNPERPIAGAPDTVTVEATNVY